VAARRRRPERFLNRELSWLDFNERVVALAEDPTQPLLERAKFCAIFSSNLDEFFQVRVAGLKDQVAAGVATPTPDGRSPVRQLVEIRDRVEALVERQRRAFSAELVPSLAAAGVGLVGWSDLDRDERKMLTEEFIERMFPVLTPLAVDPSHPFPYISDLSLNLAVVVRRPDDGEERFARVKVPPLLPRFAAVSGSERFVPIDEVIAEHVGFLFPGMEIVSTSTFRVTRNADLTLEEEEADDLLAAVEMELRRRRFQRAVRLEVSAGMPADVLDLLINELELDQDDVYVCEAPLDLAGLWAVAAIDRPDLKHDLLSPSVEGRLFEVDGDEAGDVFSIIRRGDVLVHHPYVSFRSSVEAFIARAAADQRVMAIKMTLYRTSGDSPIVASLISAAEEGKQVVAMVELKARFDERANIGWARRLEEAGVHVVYGLVGLKTHGKVVLVIRDDPDGLRRYCHVGTGNYNSRTARTYEDLGLFTADADVGNDVIDLFNFLTGFGYEPHFSRLLVAPHELRPAMMRLIDGEQGAGRSGRIVMKMNSLVDPEIIAALYAASGAGAQIDLIVRGICCLVPGVRGQSENIRVRSLVGRYLEHSRIFHFGNGDGPGKPVWYIGSADVMPRNLDRRVEVLASVTDAQLCDRLQQIIDVNLADDTLAWTLSPDGCWHRVGGGDVDTHVRLHELTADRSRSR
jgi:polyphosphate kinase